jgi:hypothetical protein
MKKTSRATKLNRLEEKLKISTPTVNPDEII